MMPALQISLSSLVLLARNFLAPAWTEANEARSSSMNETGVDGYLDLMFVIKSLAFSAERPVE